MFATLFIAILWYETARSQMEKSVVWDKNRQGFVELSKIPRFTGFQRESSEEDPKPNDISGKVITVSYYEEQNMIMFYENDTKVTGICGEIWNLLAYRLNFTLKPVKSLERNFGERLENGSYTGLLGLFHRNETQVILRTGYYVQHGNLFDYTTPVWNTKFRLHIKPKYVYDNQWIMTMFTKQTWLVIVLLFVVLSIAGCVLQNEKHESKKRRNKPKSTNRRYDLNDHFFYTYSMICGQGYLPTDFYSQNKILTLSKTIFAWLTLLAFSSNLIYRMTNRTMLPPFKNLDAMLNKTNYELLVFKGSMIYELLKSNIERSPIQYNYALSRRIHFLKEPSSMYKQICFSKKLYATLDAEDKVFLRSKGFCSVIPIGVSYFQTWIAFAIPKRFPYKRAIDKSIMKLHEAGLLDALKKRWLNYRMYNKERSPFKTIDLDQVYLIFLILLIGTIISLVIFSLENIAFLYEKNNL